MVKEQGLELLSCEEQPRKLGLFSLEKSGSGGNLINVYKYPKEGCKEHADRFFSMVPSNRTRSNGHKLECQETLIYCESDQALPQVGSCGVSSLER